MFLLIRDTSTTPCMDVSCQYVSIICEPYAAERLTLQHASFMRCFDFGLQYKIPSGGDGVQLADGSFVYSFNGGIPNNAKQSQRRQSQVLKKQVVHPSAEDRSADSVGYWGLMHLNASGAPIASHHFGDTLWGHNCMVTPVPGVGGSGPQGFILAGNMEDTTLVCMHTCMHACIFCISMPRVPPT